MNSKKKSTHKGIDVGFAYNPGKAWLEPKTVPPLPAEYRGVLEARGLTWPAGFECQPAMPKVTPRKVAATDLLSDTSPAAISGVIANAFMH